MYCILVFCMGLKSGCYVFGENKLYCFCLHMAELVILNSYPNKKVANMETAFKFCCAGTAGLE